MRHLRPIRFATQLAIIITFAAATLAAQTGGVKRPVRVTDFLQLRDVNDPQLSPDGAWIAYTVTSIDTAKDKSDVDVWMTSWDGSQSVRLTSTPERESSPRWSPDGRYLAFLSGRQDGKGAQVWLLDRRGGEAQRVSRIEDGVSEIEWSPDSRRLVLVASLDTTVKHDSSAKTDTSRPKPIVIDRFVFKRDVEGYLTTSLSHLLTLDVSTRKVDTLTSGGTDDDSPRWSPDGKRIAFVRSVLPEPGKGEESDVWVVDAQPHATPKRLTSFPGPDQGRLAWSPDGQWIAFFRTDDPKYYAYQMPKLALVRSDGSAPARVLTAKLDRPVQAPSFTADGQFIRALVVDDRAQYLAQIRVTDGSVERITPGKNVVGAYSALPAADGRVAMLVSTPERPPEVFAAEGASMRQLSHQNDSLIESLQIAPTEDITSHSSDGTEVHGLVVRPVGTAAGTRLPMILYIHGGPNSQDNYSFSFNRQLFASNGYAVLSVNYRGSNGRGAEYTRAIFADWGHKEVLDLLGAVDEAVKTGIADPDRLAVGGWSYGGILTDYLIATTTRFKAAISGAGSALQLAMWGVDEYATQYDLELGAPWKKQELWLKVSYPFFHADRIKTPTLFMGGASDFNVPIVGGEQMYQALRTTGVPTSLVIYPNQFHGLTRPSFLRDRLERFVGWYDRWLKANHGQVGDDASGAVRNR
jgi:dipeptidyl aminopeptidase/acylaminoacyl peptidase